MKSVNSFVKALGENYYTSFLSDPDTEVVYNPYYSLPVYYKNKLYYSFSNDDIHHKRREIITKIKEIYQNALSEIYLNIASQDPENFDAFLIFNIEAVKLHLKILKADFYVDNNQSRYYSTIENYTDIKGLERIDFLEMSDMKELDNLIINISSRYKYAKVDSLDHIEFMFERSKTLSFMPLSLFNIGHSFIVQLTKIQKIVNDLKEEKQVNPRIKWSGKKTHIGYILGNLALNGFIDAPKNKNGEINFTAFAKLIKQNFDVDVDQDTLRKYLNPEDDKYEENKKSFDNAKFNIPNIIEVS